MEATRVPRVKVCCIGSTAEAWIAIRLGASALGLVSRMPSGPGVIDDATIAEVAAVVPPGVSAFLLTCEQEVEALAAQQRRLCVGTLQLCDWVGPERLARLREALPGIKLVQVVHVRGEVALREAAEAAPHVDAVLLDSGNPDLSVKELGGTGRRHDWAISRRIREQAPVPVFLAGGLTAENVREAIAQVGPYGLDVCSGVRRAGALDERRLYAFMEAAAGSATAFA
jgi:phosphoribosylanthranilate isomerase